MDPLDSPDALEGTVVNRDQFFFDGEGVGEDDLGKSQIVNKEGWYHLECSGMSEELDPINDKGEEKSPSLRFELTVLETVAGQSPAGTKQYHSVWMAAKGGAPATKGSRDSALRFGIGMGVLKLVTEGENSKVVDAETGSTRITIDTFKKIVGKQTIAQIVYKPADGKFKEGYEIPFGRCYRPDDPYVDTVPKSVAALEAAGIKASPGSRAKTPPGGTKAQGSARNEKKDPPPVSDDTLKDL